MKGKKQKNRSCIERLVEAGIGNTHSTNVLWLPMQRAAGGVQSVALPAMECQLAARFVCSGPILLGAAPSPRPGTRRRRPEDGSDYGLGTPLREILRQTSR